jgi:Family of unknown function (DUF6491)
VHSGRPRRLALGLCLALGLHCSAGGPGSGAVQREPSRFPEPANRCVLKRSITSWRPIDARRFKLFADREYVVELSIRCSSLSSSEEIAFLSRDAQVCDYRSDEIQTDRETCRIGSIRTVEELEGGRGGSQGSR